ncbi:MAG TPA: flagellar basal-body rod protein FlgG [Rhodospirillaceae bacterium]|nr:flagellar basal-body rod protein FlgG [Alphaproteobacteria bacterium]OUT39696.1 MAG: flagellar basal-body rod protein FlgG [Micavibrio sp. TMED2]HCI47484.1 flagellar basal-body rod protein FlgG [Rhodospirillaceae bacterium]MAS49092.1 flagellar basal-body rod protein FlgG [Alphaproteobacteria bacterium]MAX97306.1 flagellar basal-body rod protein FlgG [Alphaproteobacteria bacterium]|tara:strand:- start:31703 stop:32488 length:786 start_codon:yes stop_codon:yes gene_type:complete
MQALNTAATGMLAQQLNVEVMSNNIANLTTTGFKRQRAEFQDLLYLNVRRPGATSSDIGTVVPSGIQVGVGVRAGAVYRILEQGQLQFTENPLDIAIDGNGYFNVELPNGETGYTRSGAFALNDQGEIVTPDGFLVEPGITIPDDAVAIDINRNGSVFVKLDAQEDLVEVGQIQMTVFANPNGLEAIGDNLLLVTEASGDPIDGFAGDVGFGTIEQGALESSNVDVVNEITDLITAQRAYEMNSKVIQTVDEMFNVLNQVG